MNLEIPLGLTFLAYGASAVWAWKQNPEHKRFRKLHRNSERWGNTPAFAYHWALHVGIPGALGLGIIVGSIQAGP